MKINALLPARALLATLSGKSETFVFAEEPQQPAAAPGAPALPVSPQPGQPLGSVQMLVTLAAYDPDRERRRRMAEHGTDALDALEELQVELAAGGATPERLEQLAQWVEQAEPESDPVLAAILAEIDLRVRVELAKFDIEV